MVSKAALQFLQEHNRPFSFNEIQSGAKGNIGKSALQKALDELINNEEVVEKTYGKQKVYFLKQKNDASSTREMNEKLLEMDRKINELTMELKEVTQKLGEHSKVVKQNEGKIPLEQAIEVNMKLEASIEETTNELKRFDDIEFVDGKQMQKVAADVEKISKEYTKRKRLCMDMLNAILENYPKSKKQLFEDIGIETDEDAGFSINN